MSGALLSVEILKCCRDDTLIRHRAFAERDGMMDDDAMLLGERQWVFNDLRTNYLGGTGLDELVLHPLAFRHLREALAIDAVKIHRTDELRIRVFDLQVISTIVDRTEFDIVVAHRSRPRRHDRGHAWIVRGIDGLADEGIIRGVRGLNHLEIGNLAS